MKCNIKHKHGGQVCIRQKEHDGLCRSKAEPGMGGTITYSEWKSINGEFAYHVRYQTIYTKNAGK